MQSPLRFTLTLMVQAAIALLLQSVVWATTISGSSEELVFNNPPAGVITIKIASPDGEVFTSDELIIRPMGSGFPDGVYKYELMGELSETAQDRRANSNRENNGRSGNVTLLTPVGGLTEAFSELSMELSLTTETGQKDNGRSGNVTLLTPVGGIDRGVFRIVNGVVVDTIPLTEQ